MRSVSRRWGEGDGVAECFELVDEVIDLAVGVDLGGVEVGAEVVEAQTGVGQEVVPFENRVSAMQPADTR
jgi:hypothetical protein